MKTRTATRPRRGLAATAVSVAVAWAAFLPGAAAHAAVTYTPDSREWWLANWKVQQEVWPDTEGAGVTVGVVDSGVQASLPDLQGAVTPGADMLGYSGNGEKDYGPDGGHGTEVATLIAGQGKGGGPVGIAPQAKILPVHAINPGGAQKAIANGIKYAVDHGAKVINLSIGGVVPTPAACDAGEQEAIAYALAHDVVVVAGAGDTNKNGPGPEEPGTCAGALTVGGVEQDGSLWQYSTQGPEVTVAAPGDHIFVVSSSGKQVSVNSWGTSYSAPLVAGAAALIRSKYPSMPWYNVVQRLIDTAIPDGQVPNDGTGYGIINVNKAVHADKYPVSASAPNPVYTRYLAWLKTPDGQQFAQANGISVGQPGNGTGAQPQPAQSSGGSGTLIIVAVVVVILIVAGVVIAVVVSRNKSRRGPGAPGGPGGFGPPGPGYGPPPGQYPQQGHYPQQGQYPPPAQYPPPGQQYPPSR